MQLKQRFFGLRSKEKTQLSCVCCSNDQLCRARICYPLSARISVLATSAGLLFSTLKHYKLVFIRATACIE